MPTYRILIVEDSPTMRELISFALDRLGSVSVVEAGDGMEGLKKLSQERFDLVITDINMPVMDGLKLVSLIRSDPGHSKVPIIVITTESGLEDRERALALGANDCVLKPIQPSQLIEIAKKLLQ